MGTERVDGITDHRLQTPANTAVVNASVHEKTSHIIDVFDGCKTVLSKLR